MQLFWLLSFLLLWTTSCLANGEPATAFEANVLEQLTKMQVELGELRDENKQQQATIDAQQSTIDAQQSTIDVLQSSNDALQSNNDGQLFTIDTQQLSVHDLDRRLTEHVESVADDSKRDRRWKLKHTNNIAALEKRLDENAVAPATNAVSRRQLEDSAVQCTESDGPRLFVDGTCSCMKDLLIANRSVLKRLDEMEEKDIQLDYNISVLSDQLNSVSETNAQQGSNITALWAAMAEAGGSGRSSSASASSFFTNNLNIPLVYNNRLTNVVEYAGPSSWIGDPFVFENMESINAQAGVSGKFFNIDTIYCDGETTCDGSFFFNCSNVYCTGAACQNAYMFNVDTVSCDGKDDENTCARLAIYNPKSVLLANGVWPTSTTTGTVYGLSDGSTASPSTTVICDDSSTSYTNKWACVDSTITNAAVTCKAPSTPTANTCSQQTVYCGTRSCTGQSSGGVYNFCGDSTYTGLQTGSTYCYD